MPLDRVVVTKRTDAELPTALEPAAGGGDRAELVSPRSALAGGPVMRCNSWGLRGRPRGAPAASPVRRPTAARVAAKIAASVVCAHQRLAGVLEHAFAGDRLLVHPDQAGQPHEHEDVQARGEDADRDGVLAVVGDRVGQAARPVRSSRTRRARRSDPAGPRARARPRRSVTCHIAGAARRHPTRRRTRSNPDR